MSAETTVIDRLEVEIQSNSKSASDGIDSLVASLNKLKSASSLGVVTRNLKGLNTEISNLGANASAFREIGGIADSLNRLKGIGSFSGIGNSIKNLSDGLASLNAQDMGSMKTKLEGFADAVKPLENIKVGSIGTFINGLAKLDTVTENLSDEKIEAFAEKVRRLVEALGPLPTQLTSVSQGFRSMNGSVRIATTEMGGGINTTTLNMSSLINVAQGVIAAIRKVISVMGQMVDEAIQWDGVMFRFGRGFGSSAEEAYKWVQRLNDELGINSQQFMQYSSIFATMLTGFGVDTDDAAKMAIGYTELAYDIWAGYNDVYKRSEDAIEAVKSAIAGEVEPIRRAGFTIIESTLEQTAANHGLQISLENATEAQKSYLRYLTLVDQAHTQNLVGTYAREMNTAEGLMRTLKQQVKSLAQALGSLFLPTLSAVIPYMQAFVELLTDAVKAIAAFFGYEIQAVDWSSFNSLGSSADDATGAIDGTTKAVKELKNATLGIDELNIISPPSNGAGGLGAGASFGDLDINSLWDESIFDTVQSKVDELKEKLKTFIPVAAGIGTALYAAFKIFTGTELFKGIVESVKDGTWIKSLGEVLKKGFSAAWGFLKEKTFIGTIATKLSGALAGIGTFLASIPAWAFAVVAAIVGTIVLAVVDYDFTEIGRSIGKALGTVTGWIVDIGVWLWNGLTTAIDWAVENLTFENMLETLISWGVEVWPSLWKGICDGAANLWGNISEFCAGLLQGFLEGLGFTESESKTFVQIGGWLIEGLWFGIKDWFGNIIKKVDEWVDDFVAAVKDFFGVESPSTIFKEIGAFLIEGLWLGIKGWFNELIDNVDKFIDDTIEKVKEFFGIKDGSSLSFEEIGKNLVQGVINGIKGMGSSLWNSLSEWAGGVISSIKGFFDINSPSKVMEEEIGENLLAGMVRPFENGADELLKPIKAMWREVDAWWGSNAGLSVASVGAQGLKLAANGGVFNQGSLVWAGEYGPEIVANASGGKTGVMNIEQLQTAVYEGVYAAMMSTQGNSGNGNSSVHVYLDGREITASVEQRQKERGAAIMGTQVYRYG